MSLTVHQCCIKCFARISKRSKEAHSRKVCENCWSNGKGTKAVAQELGKPMTMFDEMSEKQIYSNHKNRGSR